MKNTLRNPMKNLRPYHQPTISTQRASNQDNFLNYFAESRVQTEPDYKDENELYSQYNRNNPAKEKSNSKIATTTDLHSSGMSLLLIKYPNVYRIDS